MKVQEYVGKRILAEHGLTVPKSVFVGSKENLSDELISKLKDIGFPQVLKSQVLVGGRMKAGGVVVSKSLEESLRTLETLRNKEIKGELPEGVLIEQFVEHTGEIYFSVTIDRTRRSILMVYSEHGGIDIEEVSKGHPEKVLKTTKIDDIPIDFRNVASKILEIFVKYDLTLLEVNPVGVTENGYIMLDSVIHVDDNALFRQPWILKNKYATDMVVFGGEYGVIGCGAGIVMATIDMLKEFGFEPANFYDVGGGATSENVYKALNEVSRISKKIVLNIFGGITDCLEVAKGIEVFVEKNQNVKLFVRISGNKEEQAREVLEKHNIKSASDMEELINILLLEEGQVERYVFLK
ncbi:MAG: ATP-grasp domain-containing protein [Fervidobacterium sp.]